MERFLRRHAEQFQREGCSVDLDDILHPIHDQVPPLALVSYHCMPGNGSAGGRQSQAERLVTTRASLPKHQVQELHGVASDCVLPEEGRADMSLSGQVCPG